MLRRLFLITSICSCLLTAQSLIQVGIPLPEVLDLTQADVENLVVNDSRNPAQVESVRRAWLPIIEAYKTLPSLRLRLPRDERRLPLLLAANQSLKAQNPEQRLFLAYDPLAPGLWNEAAWGAIQGGLLSPDDLGNDPSRWRNLLAKAQEQLPGRPWTLWLPSDPGPLASTLLGDGGLLVVPALGPAARLAASIPDGYTEVEGGTGDLTLRSRITDQSKRWRFQKNDWISAELPKDRHEVSVVATAAYDVPALLARMRAVQLRDRMAIRTLEARLDVDLLMRPENNQTLDIGLTFRYFDQLGKMEEALQQDVRLNGMKANLSGTTKIPIVESGSFLAAPGSLGYEEHYRYTDGGPAIEGRRWLHFNPVDPDARLFKGKMLVDEKTGRVIEEHSSRSNLPGVVKSEERVLTYGEPMPGYWRVVKSDSHERWLWQDGVCQVNRIMVYSEASINSDAFVTHRDAARASKDVMLIQTTDGVKHFTRQSDGTRKIDGKAKTYGISAGVGCYLDPRIDGLAIPIYFLSYYDFNAFNRGIQINSVIAGVFNSASVHIPRLVGGVDVSVSAQALFLALTEHPVKNGIYSDRDAVDHQSGGGRIILGRDLAAGFRLEASGSFREDRFRETKDEYAKTPGFTLPPSGGQQWWQGTLRWQQKDFQMRGFYGEIRRPAGTYGTAEDPQTIPDNGHAASWGGITSLNHQFDSKWQIHGEAGYESGRGFDRFLALSSESKLTGMKALPPANRADYLEAGVTLPPNEDFRLSLNVNRERLQAADDQKTYGFSSMTVSGNFTGFGWFTEIQLNLNIGLQSDVPAIKGVNGTLMLMIMF